MRVAFLTLATEGGASPRHRVYQYLPWLERAGIGCTVFPAVSARTSLRLYATGRPWSNAAYQAAELLRRLGQLWRSREFDVVVVQKALLTVGLRGLDAVARTNVRRLVVDVDDAVHLGPAHDMPAWLRPFEDRSQPARLVARADRIIAGSSALATAVADINRRVTVVPTSVDTDVLTPAPRPRNPSPVVGWIGSPSTAPYLAAAGPALRRLARRRSFVLRVVGGTPPALPGVEVEIRPWDHRRELADLRGFDVGIMPLPDTDWTRGKCGLKALQYMAVGVPAVCSPVGATREILRHGREGFLAPTVASWEEPLERLLDDASLRDRLGGAGRARVEERYSVRANAPRLAEVLEAAGA